MKGEQGFLPVPEWSLSFAVAFIAFLLFCYQAVSFSSSSNFLPPAFREPSETVVKLVRITTKLGVNRLGMRRAREVYCWSFSALCHFSRLSVAFVALPLIPRVFQVDQV